jgi:hypothetical protein
MTTRIHSIETKYLPDYWDVLGPFIDKAASRYSKEYDLEHVWDALLMGKCMLFGIEHDGEFMGAMTVAPVNQPKRKTLTIELVGGINAGKWYYDTVKQLADVARQAGYDALSSNARRGWRNMAKESGFTETSVTYEMELG